MHDGEDKPTQYYGFDPRKITFAEYWRAPQRGSFLFGVLVKLLRLKLPLMRAISFTDSLTELDPTDLTPTAKLLQPTIDELEQLGYERAFFFREELVQHNSDCAAVVLLAPDGRAYAYVYLEAIGSGDKVVQLCWVWLISRLDRRTVLTANRHWGMNAPPEIDCEIVSGSLAAVHARHLERIAGAANDAYRGSPNAVVFDGEELRRFVLAFSRRLGEHAVARGAFKPISTDKVEALRRGESTALVKRPSATKTLLVWLGVAVLLAIIALL